MNKELKEALDILEKEKEISKDTLFEAIENSLITACKQHFGKADNVKVEIDRDTCDFLCYAEKEVVETEDDVEDDCLQIPLEQARETVSYTHLDVYKRQDRTDPHIFHRSNPGLWSGCSGSRSPDARRRRSRKRSGPS